LLLRRRLLFQKLPPSSISVVILAQKLDELLIGNIRRGLLRRIGRRSRGRRRLRRLGR
jgi:hypothetical protein